MPEDDLAFLREAIRLAEEAEHKGNLPIGAVIVLGGFALIQWTGPALPAECDPLYFRIQELERRRSQGSVSSFPFTL